MPHQLSIFAENKPGKMSRITKLLAEENIDLKAITISDSGDYGIIKILVDKPEIALETLSRQGIAVSLKEIVAVKIKDEPGGLFAVLQILGDKNINIDDAYGFPLRTEDFAVFVFQTSDPVASEKILQEAGYEVLSDQSVYYLS